MHGNQFPNSQIGQSAANPMLNKILRAPDTDSRLIKVVNGATNVAPNFMHDHTRFEYVVPVGNNSVVNFNNPINSENRSLHWLVLDNSNNSSVDKTFNFSNAYKFLDDPGNMTNSYTVEAGKKYVWFAAFVRGKLYLRVASETTA